MDTLGLTVLVPCVKTDSHITKNTRLVCRVQLAGQALMALAHNALRAANPSLTRLHVKTAEKALQAQEGSATSADLALSPMIFARRVTSVRQATTVPQARVRFAPTVANQMTSEQLVQLVWMVRLDRMGSVTAARLGHKPMQS